MALVATGGRMRMKIILVATTRKMTPSLPPASVMTNPLRKRKKWKTATPSMTSAQTGGNPTSFFIKKHLTSAAKCGIIERAHHGCNGPNFRKIKSFRENFL
jgi:hypothetical protein